MKVPERFKIRIAGNFYRETPNLIVCGGTTILRVEREESSGDLLVQLAIFDSSGRRKAVVEDSRLTEGSLDEYSVEATDHTFKVREIGTGRVICDLHRCAATRTQDLDAFLMSHAPNGFFIHANPVQTNLSAKATGETYRKQDAALVMK